MHASGPHGAGLAALIVGLAVFSWVVTGIAVSRMSGWHRLAERFAFEGDFPASRWRFKSATARYGTNYNNCLTIAADAAGFYMAMPIFFRIGHPPLFIPWNEITILRGRVLYWKVVRIQFGRDEPITLGFREDFAEEIRRAAGSSWPNERVG